MSIEQWLNEAKYMPPIIRDFHAQKDLFKAIAPVLENYKAKAKIPMVDIGWTGFQCLTIDVFLWFMAKHGYTLQKMPKAQRERVGAHDLAERIKSDRDARREAQKSVLSSLLAPKPTPIPEDEIPCPNCGGTMGLNEDVLGRMYVCLSEATHECPRIEVDTDD